MTLSLSITRTRKFTHIDRDLAILLQSSSSQFALRDDRFDIGNDRLKDPTVDDPQYTPLCDALVITTPLPAPVPVVLTND